MFQKDPCNSNHIPPNYVPVSYTLLLFMAVPFAGLIFLAKADSIKRKVITALIAMVGLLGIMVFEKEAYGSEEWQAYLSYNDERSMVYDYYGVPRCV